MGFLTNRTGSHVSIHINGNNHTVHVNYDPDHPKSVVVINLPQNPVEPIHQTESGNSVLLYILVPLGVLILLGIIALGLFILIRKSRAGNVRHHLMPLYSYDPEEDDGDWEAELLEDDREQQRALRTMSTSPTGEPRLTFIRSGNEM